MADTTSTTAPPTTDTGQQALGGTQTVQDQWNNWLAQFGALNTAQQIANNYAIGLGQIQAQYAQTQQAAQAAQAQFSVNLAQAQSQYANDVATFGLQKANDIYQANVSQAQLALQQAQAQQQNAAFQLSQAQANATQRQQQASAYQDAENMLAARTGPQDEVAYQRLVAGLAAPGAESTTTLDPLAYVRNMYQPSNIASPDIPQMPTNLAGAFNGVNGLPSIAWPSYPAGGNYTMPAITAPDMYNGTGAGGGGNGPAPSGSGATTTGQPQPASTTYKPLASYVGAPGTTGTFANGETYTNAGWGTSNPPAPTTNYGPLSSYVGAPGTTGTFANGETYYNAGSGTPTALTGPAVTQATAAAAQYPPGLTLTDQQKQAPMQQLASGGAAANPAMAIVGEGHGPTPAKTAEIAQALIDPRTGTPVLNVIPHSEAQEIINRASIPRADTGGTYGTALNSDTLTFNQYSPSVMGSQPFYQQLQGQSASRPFGAFGATLSNPALGIDNAPTNINLRTYNYLNPSQQAGFQSLYGQGLAVNPADIVAQAQNAAPTGMYYGYTPLLGSRYGG